MKLVVAEKPSVMRDIAAVLGATQNCTENALCGNGYIVTSAKGHLVRLKTPDEYDERYKKWELSALPILPDFELVPVEDDCKYLKSLSKLMKSSEVDEIIEATDAGREGECIFRYIYNYIGCKKPVRRLWISSMTEASIRAGFDNLKPVSEYDNLYAAGFTRSKLDWLWGMNLTRLYTNFFGAKCSVGRVRTAVLNMLVQRENEVNGFTKRPFFKLKLSNGAEWYSGDEDSFYDRLSAERILAKCENQPCKVISVKKQNKKENRPLLFSLTSLQIAANDELDFTAVKTLAVMQSLYEKKLLTYPRTDSSYLTDDMAAILPERVRMLRCFDDTTAVVEWLLSDGLNIDSRIINNAKVSDHHAIIPTENIGNAINMELTDDEKDILDLVITRFLVALSPQHEYTETEYIFDIAGETFKCKTKISDKLGWRRFVKPDDKDKNYPLSYSEGDIIDVGSIAIIEGETAPPKRYTESTLLKAMENIDRRIDDKELSEYVSERGLGTPATRAAISDKILNDNYAERKGKQLIPTEMGKKMIDFVPDEVKSIEMTATMELQLSAVENGTVNADEVVSNIIGKIKSIIETEKKKPHTPVVKPKFETKVPLGKCPKCGGNVFKYVRDNTALFYCENSPKTCFFRIYEDDFFFSSKGKKITEDMMKTMLTRGEVKVCGLKSDKKATTYDAFIFVSDKVRIDPKGNTKVCFDMRFENKQKKGGK